MEGLAAAATDFLTKWNPPVDIVVPVPASNCRRLQPAILVARAISQSLNLPFAECIVRGKDIPQLKDVSDLDERLQLLSGLHTIDAAVISGKNVLLFDDLFRSGATMNSIADTMYEQGGATSVYALTLTRTWSNV